jgi:hypothetical protein
MDRDAISAIYSNVFSIGYFEQDKKAGFDAFLKTMMEAGIAKQPFPITIAGTGFILEGVLGVTAAHIVDSLEREIGVPGDQVGLFYVADTGRKEVDIGQWRLGTGTRIFRFTRPDEEPSEHTQRLPIQWETDFAFFPAAQRDLVMALPSCALAT